MIKLKCLNKFKIIFIFVYPSARLNLLSIFSHCSVITFAKSKTLFLNFHNSFFFTLNSELWKKYYLPNGVRIVCTKFTKYANDLQVKSNYLMFANVDFT